jgi:hypothetical protein
MSVTAPPSSPASALDTIPAFEDDDGRLCHTLHPDTQLPMCGKRIRSTGSGGGIHTTSNPLLDPCDGCGTPRCPACAALCSRRG